MIKETDGDCFETMRCLNQNLTFEATKKEFELRDVYKRQALDSVRKEKSTLYR